LSLGSIIDYAERNFGGIIVSMPFGCMPGINVDAILPKVRKVVRRLKGRNIPILTCIDDETKQPNSELLLQLLVEQAKNDLKRQ
jgi:predicted nucleotide-binding protein (sugar kinase/HSP70/actin superfamily)